MKKKLILASASPRRREIFERLGLDFEIIPAKGEERLTTSDPAEAVRALALQKASEVARSLDGPALVVGSDTVVAWRNRILGKPSDEDDAFRMLRELQGETHMVYTGVAVIDTEGQKTIANFTDGTSVSMYPMTDEWIRDYIRTGEPMDKAGAYAIQGGCMPYIRGIEGEYETVVGFPAARFYQEMLRLGIDLNAFGHNA